MPLSLSGWILRSTVDTESRKMFTFKRKADSSLLNISMWGAERCKQIKLFYFSALYLYNLLKTTTSSGSRAAASVSPHISPPSTVFALSSTVLRKKKTKRRYFLSSSFIKMNVLTPCRPPGE